VSDGFDFSRPERREAKRFEPPPWEADAFEELRRQRVEECPEAEKTGAIESDPHDEDGAKHNAEEPDDEPKAGEKPARVDEAQMLVMLAELASEEPSAQEGLHTIAAIAAMVMVVSGLVLVVWGMVALADSGRSGRVGVVGGVLFFLLGSAAVGFAVWLIVRTLRQRGVL